MIWRCTIDNSCVYMSTIESPILRNKQRKMTKSSCERMRLLFIAMNWILQVVPLTRQWTNSNYTERSACFAIESNDDYNASILWNAIESHPPFYRLQSPLSSRRSGVNYFLKRHLLKVSRLVRARQQLVKYQPFGGWVSVRYSTVWWLLSVS